MLIGVYVGDVIVASFPANLRLQYYVEYLPDRVGSEEIFFKFYNSADKGEMKIKASVEVFEPSVIADINPPQVTVTVSEESTLDLSISLDGETWKLISSKRVIRGELPNAPPVALSKPK